MEKKRVNLLKVLLNKYLLTILVFLFFMFFFSDYNLCNRWHTKRNVKQLEKEIRFYQKEIETNKQKMNDMHSNDENLERYAREKYFLKKENEDIFIIKEE